MSESHTKVNIWQNLGFFKHYTRFCFKNIRIGLSVLQILLSFLCRIFQVISS